jgi:hypothetical protein
LSRLLPVSTEYIRLRDLHKGANSGPYTLSELQFFSHF